MRIWWAIFIILFSFSAFAADVCKEEREKYCPGKEWGAGLDQCLKENHRHLSAECRRLDDDIKVKSIEKDPEIHRRSGASCKDDGDKYCRGIRKRKLLHTCLKAHYQDLTEDCRGIVDRNGR